MLWFIGILVGLIVLLFIIAIALYNGMVGLKVRGEGAWSDIDVILKKRYDLIPNLVNVVKGYAKHESETLEKVVQARNQAINIKADDVEAQIKAQNALSSTLRSMFSLTENYPELKANSNFQSLMSQLQTIETEIERARRYYNAVSRDFNTKILIFPGSIIANMNGFKKMPFYEVENAEERQNVKVEF
jgi:LemA protein